MNIPNGYAGDILYVDLTDQKIRKEPVSQKLIDDLIGGSGFGHKLIYDLLKPGTEPASPDNPIIISTGALAGSIVPSASKVQVTTKFAIGTVGTGYGGGSLSPMLKWAGYDCAVITGRAEKPVFLKITDEDVSILDARELWGKDISETTIALWDEYGDSGVLAIGPAGENLVSASFAKIDNLSTMGRGGLGLVMGSKNLKAIIAHGRKTIIPALPNRFSKVTAEARKSLLSLPYREGWTKYGIMMAWDMWERIGFTKENFDNLFPKKKARELFGKDAFDKVRKKTIACTGCLLGDKVLIKINEGEYAGLEAPITHSMGHVVSWGIRAGAKSNEMALVAHEYCDRQGLDEWVSTGLIDLAIRLYEQGIITKEDTDGIELKREFRTFMTLTEQIARKQGLGIVLGEGFDAVIKKFGEKARQYAVQIKGLDPFIDPRGGSLGFGLEQCVNPRGVSCIPVSSPANVSGRKPESFARYLTNLGASKEKVGRVCVNMTGVNIGRLTRWVEDFYSVNNALGVCTRQPIYQCYTGDMLAEFYSSLTGIEKTKEEMLVCGERAWNILKALNVREGFDRSTDKWPEKFFESIPTEDGGKYRMHDYFMKDYLTEKDIDKMFDDYYDERGWDLQSAIPSRNKLEELSLQYISEDLERFRKS